jgi:hypothetical protein
MLENYLQINAIASTGAGASYAQGKWKGSD